MEAGKYRGKAIGYAIGRASTGTEQVGISFEMQVGEGKEYITWYGYFSEATAERTIKTLHTLGLAHDDLDKIAEDGSDFPNEVELDIQRDEKGYLKVAWVNRVGAGVAMKDVMNPAEKMAFAQRMRDYPCHSGAILLDKPLGRLLSRWRLRLRLRRSPSSGTTSR